MLAVISTGFGLIYIKTWVKEENIDGQQDKTPITFYSIFLLAWSGNFY